MRQAMADAIVGDDQYGEDPTVNRLEALAAQMVGKEAAVYVPSGTMGNVSAMMARCGRGDEAILGDESHIYWFESGSPAALGGITQFILPTEVDGTIDPTRIELAIRVDRSGYPRTQVICIENTHNRRSGRVLPLSYMREVAQISSRHNVPVHLDGARIFNAAAALGVGVPEITAHVDSVQFCLSKALAAPVGSVVAGSADFIERVRRQRKLLGGAMRQAGVIAAAGIVALETMVDRLPEDHVRAKRLAASLARIAGVTLDPEGVQTNIVVFQVDGSIDQTELAERLKERGLLVSNYGAVGLRMVTHVDVDDADVDKALDIIGSTVPTMLEGSRVRAAD
ncbi:MAG: aminotransferase class I/II-fold pyridoxal phosphate-dependent enzyme [Chloroflexia bacterium]|nr:aminotransferase class I/II-fold pyridoxal phosphate-dependent enzyme [Chloroflexia bacterium]